MSLAAPPWIADLRSSAALYIYYFFSFLTFSLTLGVVYATSWGIPSFRAAFISARCVPGLFDFLGIGLGWFLGVFSYLPRRSVSGLVWIIGAPLRGTGHVPRVLGWVFCGS